MDLGDQEREMGNLPRVSEGFTAVGFGEAVVLRCCVLGSETVVSEV